MHITKAHFTNYRCFEDYEIEFASHVNILIGVNGSGKSNVLSALRKSLSFMFGQHQDYTKRLNTSNNSNLRAFAEWDARFTPSNGEFIYPVELVIDAIFEQQNLHWSLKKRDSKGAAMPTLYRDELAKVLQHYSKEAWASMPLLAFYSDAFPHTKSNIGKSASNTVTHDALPRDFAYYGWDEDTNCMELWTLRYKKLVLSLFGYNYRDKEANSKLDTTLQHNLKELQFVENKLISFTALLQQNKEWGLKNEANERLQIKEINMQPRNGDLYLEFVFKNGRRMPFETLPQGYKRLFSLVLDLAFRAYTLNQERESGGIVFIDEVDLHLHPSLQQEVVQRFSRSFPEMQFILTTHSPLVLTNLKTSGEYADKQRIIQLSTNENNHYSNEIVEGIYGIDYSTAVSEIMHTPARNSTVEKYLQLYTLLKERGRSEKAQEALQSLKKYLGLSETDALPETLLKTR